MKESVLIDGRLRAVQYLQATRSSSMLEIRASCRLYPDGFSVCVHRTELINAYMLTRLFHQTPILTSHVLLSASPCSYRFGSPRSPLPLR